MKFLVLTLMFALPSMSQAGPTQTIELQVYRYAGSLEEITKTLTSGLANQVQLRCGKGPEVEFSRLTLDFKLGELSAGKTLPAELKDVNGMPELNFPHHPQAKLSASFDCK